MNSFLSGGVFVAALLSALYFLRFWKETKDIFFLLFSFSFLLMGLERVPIFFGGTPGDTYGLLYLFRLSAFLLILFAIWSKNREGSESA